MRGASSWSEGRVWCPLTAGLATPLGGCLIDVRSPSRNGNSCHEPYRDISWEISLSDAFLLKTNTDDFSPHLSTGLVRLTGGGDGHRVVFVPQESLSTSKGDVVKVLAMIWLPFWRLVTISREEAVLYRSSKKQQRVLWRLLKDGTNYSQLRVSSEMGCRPPKSLWWNKFLRCKKLFLFVILECHRCFWCFLCRM